MGNTSSAISTNRVNNNNSNLNFPTKSNCNSCSQNGQYFNFGKNGFGKNGFGKNVDNKLYVLIKGKQRRVYIDLKGKYYRENSKKKYLKKGTKTYKLSTKQKLSTKRESSKRKSPTLKTVKDNNKNLVGYRLSARTVFDQKGKEAIGKPFKILQKDGTYQIKYLRLRKNKSPYFANNFGKNKLVHLEIPLNKNWLRGSFPVDDMTGLKYSWPTFDYNIPPAGVRQPFKTSLLPKVSSKIKRGNNYNVPHMHYGKMCFGA